MTGRYKAYPEYKESEVEWLGTVPQDWPIHSLKRTVDRVTNGIWGSEPDSENDLIVLRVADFNRNQLNISDDKLTFRSIDPKDRSARLLKKGDLLIEKSGGGDKTLVGCVVLFDKEYPAVTSNFVAKMTPQQGFDSSFLRYAFSKLYAGKVNFLSIKQTTGIQNLDSDAYLLESFAFPSFEEQQKIANFLDHETAKIDTLITKQEKLIELLKEKRQAVISHAVTKGLNPNAPMKDSGVEWLGEVPEHWDIFRSKRLFPESKNRAPISDTQLSATQDYGVISQKRFMQLAGRKVVQLNSNQELRKKVQVGDFVISMRSFQGGLERAWEEGGIRSSYVVLKPSELTNKDYFQYLFKSVRYIQAIQSTANFIRDGQDMNYQNFILIDLPLPSLEEQKHIASFLREHINQVDSLIGKAQKAILLMQERKTALISAAVTGKIDVRDWIASDEVTNG
ncbi:restriction endonuclease subunit S [Vibrio cincinnatiensis]|uniref:restriction endonuclease subunit S n=1 Tax=Vibrio cincinnatiensis TaxID=675 RepID=UPI001EE04800|nr:restriction endonuclease subunit S [Vibrio cincinnatiensis]MCG3765409.1 restriction endonuclease subunit S [Vibrio cincinnatiensis]